MKPNFALTLSPEGITLLYRSPKGWTRVGDVALDSEDLGAALTQLRNDANHLADAQTCKLVIPNDQIKYLTIEAADDSDAAVRAALDGATPYAVEDLEYDWSAGEGRIQIAAVALETLTEAEAFAVDHGFEPVSFAAIPEPGDFEGEPFFGVTRRAAQTLPEATKIERDSAPITIIGDAPRPDSAGGPEDSDTAETPDHKQPDMTAPAMPAPDPSDTAQLTGTVAPAAAKAVAEAGPAPQRQEAGSGAKAPASPAAPPDMAPAAFASIRASRGPGAGAISTAPPLSGQPRLTRLGGADAAAPAGNAPPVASPASDGVSDPARVAALGASLQPDPDARLDPDAAPGPRHDAEQAPANGKTGFFGGRDGKRGDRTAAASPREDERQRLTIFGARQSQTRGKPRFLGLILTAILLLFLVGVAAWASMFLDDGLARFFGGKDDIKLADVPASSSEETSADLPASPKIAPLPGTETDAVIAALPDAEGPRDAPPDPRPEVAALPDQAAPLAPSEALASYAATGIWQMAPAPPEIPTAGAPLEDLVRLSRDARPGLGDPAEMPRRGPDASDTVIDPPMDPPPPGMRFDFDARGLVRATPEGAMTPQGVRVIAGRPPLVPPADMAQTASLTPSTEAETAQTLQGAEEVPQAVQPANPALANIRPRVRPDTAAPPQGTDDGAAVPPSAEETEIANNAMAAPFVGDPSLAALRPKPRSDAAAAAAATLRTASGGAAEPLVDAGSLTNAIAAAGGATQQDPEEIDDAATFESATPQAVKASLLPLRRPGDFESIVKQTRASTPIPENQRLQPSLPSSASVAKQATTEGAINLRKVNLIGVYGNTAQRRALVRLGNGRYQKVQVGDKLDGGQVAAIGNGELRYIKKGRNVVLRMPQG